MRGADGDDAGRVRRRALRVERIAGADVGVIDAVRIGVGGAEVAEVELLARVGGLPVGETFEVLAPVEVGVGENLNPATRTADGDVEVREVVGEDRERFDREEYEQ